MERYGNLLLVSVAPYPSNVPTMFCLDSKSSPSPTFTLICHAIYSVLLCLCCFTCVCVCVFILFASNTVCVYAFYSKAFAQARFPRQCFCATSACRRLQTKACTSQSSILRFYTTMLLHKRFVAQCAYRIQLL